jgi:hypothetical protein
MHVLQRAGVVSLDGTWRCPGTLVFAGLQPGTDLLVLFFFFSSFFSSGSLDQRGRRD